MARRPRSRKSSPSFAVRVLWVGAFATTFVVGVLVGQHVVPRPVQESYTAATLEDDAEGESLRAPVPERAFTFYDRLPGESAAPSRSAEDVAAAGESRTEAPAADEPAVRALVREERPPAVEPRDGGSDSALEPAQARVLARASVGGDESGAAAPHPPREAPVPPPVSPAAAPQGSERGVAVLPRAGSADAPAAAFEATGEALAGEPVPAAPVASRVLSRAPVPAAGGLEGEVTSAASWEEAQSIRSLLSSRGVETAVITVDDPGTGRRLAVLVRPGADLDGRVSEARRLLAEADR